MRHRQGCALVILDGEATTEVIAALMRQAGYRAVLTTSATQAMQHATRPLFDFVIVGWTIQGGLGLRLCRKLKEFAPETPVFLYTADVPRPDLKRAAEAGATGVVDSPLAAADIPRLLDVKKTEEGLTGGGRLGWLSTGE